MIKIDFTKAQSITKDRLREERKPLLEKLDVQVMQNISNPTKLAEIEAQKQVLRDITALADSAQTLDELKAINV